MNARHYHVTERVGDTERVVATFASAFQAGRDMALRERSHVTERERSDEPSLTFGSPDDDRRDALRRDAPRVVIRYVACSCAAHNAPAPPPVA